jgi:hypothetical protein
MICEHRVVAGGTTSLRACRLQVVWPSRALHLQAEPAEVSAVQRSIL